MPAKTDAIVVGSGPNGLAAAIVLARAGRSVRVVEAAATPGGGCRSAELTRPGFVHDICSAVHPMGVTSPFFRTLPLDRHGLSWVHPELCMAHPLDDGTAAVLDRSLDRTAEGLGEDGRAWERLMGPLVQRWDDLLDGFLRPLLPPHHPLVLARFGVRALWPADTLARTIFRTDGARALFGGVAAHAILPLGHVLTTAFGLVLGAGAHAGGWPVSRGGSQAISDALVSYLESLGGEVVTGQHITSMDQLPPTRAVLFDLTPRQLVSIAGDRLSPRYRRRLTRFRYGPGSFKVDYALDGPIPWTAKECHRAGTVHVAGTLDEIVEAERQPHKGKEAAKPYVLVAQQSVADDTRAPAGKHTGWAYCHVPHGSTVDMTDRIEAQIERFAPGFRERVLERRALGPADLARYNDNYIGGDIAGGEHGGLQLLLRPVPARNPYEAAEGIYLCSSSTPPGAGVHGMCGFHAAHAALDGALR